MGKRTIKPRSATDKTYAELNGGERWGDQVSPLWGRDPEAEI